MLLINCKDSTKIKLCTYALQYDKKSTQLSLFNQSKHHFFNAKDFQLFGKNFLQI